MSNIQSSFGELKVFEDFQGIGATAAIADATAGTRYNDVCLIAVSGQTDLDYTVDEPNGVISFTGAGGAGDGISIVIGAPMQPNLNGTMVMEARFKNASATDFRAFVGFQETVALAEPVNPFTLSGTTLTDNDGGNVVGFYTDAAATTDDFRFHSSLDGTASTAAALSYALGGATTLGALGVRANCTLTADSWYIARVVVYPDGTAEGYFGHTSMANKNGLTLIARMKAGTLDTTALYYPILSLLATSTGDPLAEVDYVGAKGHRDWTA